nr:retrotransposon protein, putative, Ty3-gypsy subclass [Tanacetum cinerariifolium]
YHPGKANVVADALSRKSGMIAGIKVEEEIIRDLERLGIELLVEFRLDDDNVLWQDTRLVVPNDATLREALLTEAHSSPFSVHPGSTKMYHDLKQYFWWSGMKRDVATFVERCLICQQVKIEHQRASGLLQQLDIPVWKWDEISMDFVTGLPQTQRRHDAIWVVVDRLTKSAHFLPIRKDYSTDGQSERTIQTLEDMLRSCALEWTGNWDDYICLVEFAYNNSWHASIKCAPFEMLYGSSGLRRFFRYTMFLIHVIYAISCLYIRSLSVMLSRISFHVLIRQGSRCVFPTFPIVLRPFKTLCFFNYALILRQDYDITSSLRREALRVRSIEVGSTLTLVANESMDQISYKDLTYIKENIVVRLWVELNVDDKGDMEKHDLNT